jgi:polysaccharide export outer membrane protein
MRRATLPICLALAAMLQGCAAPRNGVVEVQAQPRTVYTLAPGDRVRVIVFGQDSLSNSFAVDSSGQIAMPLIGLVPANGRTTAQLSREIEQKLRDGYVREPRVSVEVEAYRPFFVLGEVTTSGQYPFVNGMTVETAVAIAGGFTPRARKDSAELTRAEGGRTITFDAPINQPVKPGDTIFIHERFF